MLFLTLLVGCSWLCPSKIEYKDKLVLPPETLITKVVFPIRSNSSIDGKFHNKQLWDYIFDLEAQLKIQDTNYTEYMLWRKNAIPETK